MPAGTAPSDSQTLEPHGSFFSTLKQGFAQDPNREVVRGHFDVSSPSGTQRYYCLLDPKTGKSEANGVSGDLIRRRDGMTGIKGAAVSFYQCAEAEQKGLLTTTGYVVPTGAAAAPRAILPKPEPASAAAAAAPPASSDQTEVLAAYTRFLAGQNAHNRAALAALLLDSKDFVWLRAGGSPIWGSSEVLDAFVQAWQGPWELEPQSQDPRVAAAVPGVAVLIAPLLVTSGETSAAPERWSLIFVRSKSGWRIVSIIASRP